MSDAADSEVRSGRCVCQGRRKGTLCFVCFRAGREGQEEGHVTAQGASRVSIAGKLTERQVRHRRSMLQHLGATAAHRIR